MELKVSVLTNTNQRIKKTLSFTHLCDLMLIDNSWKSITIKPFYHAKHGTANTADGNSSVNLLSKNPKKLQK